MDKPTLDYNTFLHELDSREELTHVNVGNYIVEEKDSRNISFELISFYPLEYLTSLLANENWLGKREDYKNYLLGRVSTTLSQLNKSQYLAILAYCFRTRIDEAFECLENVLTDYLFKKRVTYTLRILFKNLTAVAFSTKKKIHLFYQFISSIINRTDIPDTNKICLLGWLCPSSGEKNYTLTKIDNIFEVCLSLVNNTSEPLKLKNIIELSLKILERLGTEDKNKYVTKRKELYELLADNEYAFLLPDDANNLAIPHYNHMYLRKILQWYKLAGNDLKAANAEKELWKVRGKLVIPSFPVKIYTPEDVKKLNHQLEFADTCDPILFLFGLSENYFGTIPSDNLLDKYAGQLHHPDGFPFSHLDYNNNSRPISEEDEPRYKKFLIYDLCIKPTLRNFVSIFLKRIKEGTLVYRDIHLFLTSTTNFGKSFLSYRKESISYYMLVEKGLKHLFYQFKRLANNNPPDFTLSIDSLCPKIERIIREMLHALDAKILKINIKGTNSTKEEMLLLDKLLDAKELKQIMTAEDINYYRFVLTRDGWNIRNESAHGLFSPYFYSSEYGMLSAFMLFVLILRLSINSNCFQYENS